MAWEMGEVRFAGVTVRKEGLGDRKEKNMLEKGCWKQVFSFGFFGC